MTKLKSIEEANEVSAVRLVRKRQRAKVGDIFRLSPLKDIFLWGRLIKRAKFFGLDAEFNLVHIYDAIGQDRPANDLLSPQNLIMGPSVVNNLGWARGYRRQFAHLFSPGVCGSGNGLLQIPQICPASRCRTVEERSPPMRGIVVQFSLLFRHTLWNSKLSTIRRIGIQQLTTGRPGGEYERRNGQSN
jgi:hypothetical protein